ncbi:MAG: hypothetical protein HQ475_13695 [SAR202 cluster bacterium]|nr:hypothetical protein [SAR202 cluster bacterium]
MALDAGSLTSSLTTAEQAQISDILVSHSHFDHIRDIPTLGLSTLWEPGSTSVHGLPDTLSAIHEHFLNWKIYPDFTEGLNNAPAKLQFRPVEPKQAFTVLDYQIKPVPVPHPVPCVGYIVKSSSGASIAYTGDTGGGLKSFLHDPMQPGILFVDVTFPNRLHDLADTHRTPHPVQPTERVVDRIGRRRHSATYCCGPHRPPNTKTKWQKSLKTCPAK